MRRKGMALFLALCLSLTMASGGAAAAGSSPFADVPAAHWASQAVAYVYDNGLMNGVGEDTFQPGGSLTRAMFVTILGRMAGVAEGDYPGTSFTDVPAGQWYSPYVAWAAQAGVADGTGGGNFSPNRAVTREQMATMIARYTDSAGLTLDEVSDPAPSFTDQGAVASWAREGVDLMRRTGILTGYEDGSFQPQRTANRAEAAAIFMRLDGAANGTDEEEPSEETFAPITQAEGQQMVDLVNAIGAMDRQGATQTEVKNYLEGIDWVRVVEETPDGGVSCRTDFGVTGVWTPHAEGFLGGAASDRAAVQPARTVLPAAGTARTVYEAKDIAILCPYATEEGEDFLLDGYEFLANALAEHTGGTVAVLRDEAVSLAALKELDRYDMVWFYSHGALSSVINSAWAILDSDPFTMTGEFADSALDYCLYSEDFFYGRVVINLSTGRIGIGGNFYKHYYGETDLQGMFFHFGSCNSMRTDKLAEGILSRGAAWVEGWTNEVNFRNDYAHLMTVVEQLGKGFSIQEGIVQAAADAQEDYPDSWQDDCALKGLGDGTYAIQGQAASDTGWKQAYLDYIREGVRQEEGSYWSDEIAEKSTYYLFDVNGDTIPELWIDNAFTYAGGRLCTYDNGKVTAQTVYSGEIAYLPGENLVMTQVMRMGLYIDFIHRIENGQFVQVARGDYKMVYEDATSGRYHYEYTWNGTPVDEATYLQKRGEVFDLQRSTNLRASGSGLSYAEIQAKLSA